MVLIAASNSSVSIALPSINSRLELSWQIFSGKKAINFTAKQKLTKEDTKANTLDRAYSIGEDAEGNIWIGTVESGVWRYDGNSVKNFTEKDGLERTFILTIYKSKQRELWFGGNGVYRFNGKSFERIY